ncbi:cell division protein FtsH, partial [Parabacteroides sp. OttesenSCG-928-G21]|nr:cell division protein FtsH [Parabacteroides sp. OttesenSCG-928-G21]
TAKHIDKEVQKIVDEQYIRAKKMLNDNAEGHNKLAEVLLEREVIYTEDVEHIFGKRVWISRTEELLGEQEKEKEEERKKEMKEKKAKPVKEEITPVAEEETTVINIELTVTEADQPAEDDKKPAQAEKKQNTEDNKPDNTLDLFG